MFTKIRMVRLTAAVWVTALGLTAAAGADWPHFRGANYDGISAEKGFKTQWSGSLPVVWERAIGTAFSSFAAVGDHVYTCGTADKQQVLYCLNADTGEVIWQKPFEEEFPDSNGGGTRATPTVDGDRVYILGAKGRLLCANAADGKEIWNRQLEHKPKWGYAGSVLIDGDLAIVSAGGDEGALTAFKKTSGDVVWKCAEDEVGYATPYPFTFEGQRYVVGFMAEAAIIAKAGDGKLVWRLPWKTDWNVNAASPLYHDGHLLLTSGYKTGCALLRLKPDGDRLATETVWQSDVLLNKFQSCVLHEGNLYASDQKAFKCVNFLTGEKRWEKNRVMNGTLILADGHLLLLTEEGQLQVGKVSPTDFVPSATADILNGRCWTLPVLHRGRLYARNLERAVCIDLRP